VNEIKEGTGKGRKNSRLNERGDKKEKSVRERKRKIRDKYI
jgi:hypothetical protein